MTDTKSQAEETLRTAHGLVAAGKVLEVRVLQGGQVVTGVLSAEGEPQARGGRHRVYLRRGAGGECSCGAAACAHILAVSLAAERAGHSAPEPARVSAPASPVSGASVQCLHYVLHAPSRREGAWHVSLWVVQAADAGQAAQRFVPRPGAPPGEYPRYVDEADRALLPRLTAAGAGPWPLVGAAGGEALRQMLATGRARAGTADAPALRAGSARPLQLTWRVDEDGLQHLVCEPATLGLVVAEPPFYVDLADGEAGLLEVSFAPRLLAACWPLALAPEEVEALARKVASDPQGGGFPLPVPLPVRRESTLAVAGRLHLVAGPQAQASFLYNGRPVRVERSAVGAHVRVLSASGREVLELPRAAAEEERLRQELTPWLPPSPGSDRDWLRLMVDGVPALRASGWEVRIDEDFPYRLVEGGEWYADARTDGRPGWFGLTLGVQVEGTPVNLLPALTRYLATTVHAGPDAQDALLWESTADAVCGRIGGHWLLRLADGRYLAVPLPRISRIADTLVELFERTSLRADALPLPRAQGTRLAQLADEIAGLACLGDDPTLWMAPEALEALTHPPQVAAPAGFPAQLRPYQEAGLGWLQRLRESGQGGLLADDMGLGKTVQTLAHIAAEKVAGRLTRPVLIVAPVSALVTWQREIRRFMPDLDWVLWHGSRRKEAARPLAGAEVIVTGYPLLTLDSEILGELEYSLVILDEAQAIKNPHAKVAQAARGLRATHRLCLTGTPVENHLGELWSLFEFLQPGILGSESAFHRHYRAPIEKNGNGARFRALSARIAPFLLRRTKETVATELPPKTQIVESIALEERQRDFYDGIRLAMHRRVREVIAQAGIIRSQITILDALMKLRQACCDPRLVKLDADPQAPSSACDPVPSAKLEWLAQALPQLVAEGRRILLFSQFTSMLALIEEELTRLEIPYCLLTGSTRDRSAVVERFQSGAVPLFLISLKAGGTALNLTAADTVIHYDPWWNPAVEAQATDRAYRIGQDKPVFVYKLIAAGTLEERIIDLQTRKSALATALYGGAQVEGGGLTEADVEELLAP